MPVVPLYKNEPQLAYIVFANIYSILRTFLLQHDRKLKTLLRFK